jgi:hypothetical protein
MGFSMILTARIQSSKPSWLILLLSFQQYEDSSNSHLLLLFADPKWITLKVRLDALKKINAKDRRSLIRFAGCLGFRLLSITLCKILRHFLVSQQLFCWNYYRSVSILMFLNIG